MQAQEFAVTYSLTRQDFKQYYRYLFARHFPSYLQGVLLVLTPIPALYVLLKGNNPLTTPSSAIGLGVLVFFYIVKREALRTPLNRVHNTGERFLRLTSAGVEQRTDVNVEEVPWVQITDIVKARKHLYLFVSHNTAFVVPLQAFSEQESFDGFCNQALQLWRAAR